ncbi:pyruvate dehydrogenase complex dehydrogenase (E1) component [Streptomyces sp. LBL]|nr:pyruvate dehydrogenase complex dehydrogenase (E1) component [Streptomyces sp. LBL]
MERGGDGDPRRPVRLGGHISTYASAARLYETGFHHFFRGKDGGEGSGDQLYFQGHASPGIYARVFLEGRLSEAQLDGFRREVDGHGLPFYIFYAMFGFQHTGDQFWALADQMGRGFVIGATAGRTT